MIWLDKSQSPLIRVVLILLCLAFYDVTYAQKKSVATVTRVKGDALLINEARPLREVGRGQVVFSGDTIQTGNDGWVTVNFFDLTRIVLRPNSEFFIDKFPQKVGGGRVELSLTKGAARVITGIISNTSVDYFKLNTPQGEIVSSRSEWVVRLCEGNECSQLHNELKICDRFDHHTANDQVWVSVYKGNVGVEYCDIEKPVKRGMSILHDQTAKSCQVLEYIPCPILADKELGRGNLRRFLPLLHSFRKESEVDKSRKLPPKPPIGKPPRGEPRPPRGEPRPPREGGRGRPRR